MEGTSGLMGRPTGSCADLQGWGKAPRVASGLPYTQDRKKERELNQHRSSII